MLGGYVRVSPDYQNPALQRVALALACCVRIFTDIMSDAKYRVSGTS